MMWCSGNLHRHKEGEATAVLPAGQQLTSKRSFAAGRQGFTNWACPSRELQECPQPSHLQEDQPDSTASTGFDGYLVNGQRGSTTSRRRSVCTSVCKDGISSGSCRATRRKEGGFRLQCTGWVREVERITRHTFRDHGRRHITNSATRSDIGHVELWPAQEHVHPALCFFSASVGQLCRTVQPPLRAR